jgi:signal transduction histidine kinase
VALSQASRLSAPLGPVTAALIAIGYEAATISVSRTIDPGSLLSSTAGLVFAYLAMSNFRRLREEKQTTELLLREVLAGRDAQIHAATLDERTRIAREIHDILAHTLSALAVQLEGTRLLVEQRPGDPAAVAALERASGLARDGLEETKRAVGALRGDALPGPEALPRLAADFERDTGIPCRLTVEGVEGPVTPEARLSLYRTAQEALTNVRKHTLASSVAILLRYTADGAELTVQDEGPCRPTPLAGSGHGLEGMRERAELARGRLEAGPTSTGFRVRLWLPT